MLGDSENGTAKFSSQVSIIAGHRFPDPSSILSALETLVEGLEAKGPYTSMLIADFHSYLEYIYLANCLLVCFGKAPSFIDKSSSSCFLIVSVVYRFHLRLDPEN